MNIGIWGHYHGNNLGDDVVVSEITRNVRARLPESVMYGFSLNPQDTATRHGIPSYSIRFGMKEPILPPATGSRIETAGSPAASFPEAEPQKQSLVHRILVKGKRLAGTPRQFMRMRKAVGRLDVVIVAGSQALLDEWGVWAHPYMLYKLSVLCRMTGTKLVLLNVGAGPIKGRLARYFSRSVIKYSWYRSFRDVSSVAVIEALNVRGDNPCFPDLAFGLDRALIAKVLDSPSKKQRPSVGVSTMAHNDPRYWPDADPEEYRKYLDLMVEFCAWLIARGYDVVLIKSQMSVDAQVAVDLLENLESSHPGLAGESVVNPDVRDVSDLLAQLGSCDYVVGVRFHCHVLPFILGKPVLGIAYHVKSSDLMNYMGQGEYSIPITDLAFDTLKERFEDLESHKDDIVRGIQTRSAAHRLALSDQYDDVVGLLSASGS